MVESFRLFLENISGQALWLMERSAWLSQRPGLLLLLSFLGIGLLAFLSLSLTRRHLLPLLGVFVRRSPTFWDEALFDEHLFDRLAWLLPLSIIISGLQGVPHLPDLARQVLTRLAVAGVIIVFVRAAAALTAGVNAIYYRYPMASNRPIKGYLQVVQIIVHIIGVILIVAVLINRSPWYFLSGLGAMMAIILLVFRDTLLSLVAGIQLTGNDLVRVGDWIEMPQFNADGDVIDIALHAIRVQNWDRTISVIPTHKFLEHSFRNWRGMTESGGRRIMRSLFIDMDSIDFLSPDDIDRLKGIELLRSYLVDKQQETEDYNRRHDISPDNLVNGRHLTNIGTFRAYIVNYLRRHPQIRQDMILMVRQLASGPEGLPIEVYVFVADTAWPAYESVQADIFDHLLAIVPEFGLRLYQRPSGRHLGSLAAVVAHVNDA